MTEAESRTSIACVAMLTEVQEICRERGCETVEACYTEAEWYALRDRIASQFQISTAALDGALLRSGQAALRVRRMN